MEFLVQTRTYNSYGADATFSFVGDQLMLRLGEYGAALNAVHIFVYLRSPTRNPTPTLEGLFDQFHEALKMLPTITFRRKLKRVEIGYLSERFDAVHNESWRPSIENSHLAAIEVVENLSLLRKRIKPEDDFQLERFLADAREVLNSKPDSLEEWESIRQEANRVRQSFFAAKSPWEQLEIDWSQYHARARKTLDDPFYWDNSNDLSPNGNDTGADLLADYRRWDKRNGDKSPLLFLRRLMKNWCIEPIDWSISGEDTVRKLNLEHPIELSLCNEAAIGLAFAVLKMRAVCPPDLIEMAMKALKRTEILVKDSTLSNENKIEWDVAIKKMNSKLESILK